MSREEGQAERSDAPQQSSALSPQEEAVVTPEATAERYLKKGLPRAFAPCRALTVPSDSAQG